MSDFFTIESPVNGLCKERGSKFISYAFPILSEDDIRDHLEGLRKEYHDARHHCYAWVHGMDTQKWRANDDGEPAHSAGDPILGQIRSFNLTNTLVVVIRYFGGTKLGVGGLINAYKTASNEALSKAKLKKIFELRKLTLEFGYDQISTVEKLIADFDLNVQRQFDEKCLVLGTIKKDDVNRFLEVTEDYYSIKTKIES